MKNMSDFKFVHCSDLHLGSRFSGIRSKDPRLAEKMTESTFNSFSNIVDLVISEEVDFMVLSGDIFDKETITPGTRFRFTEMLKRAAVPCFIARGNHDFKTSWEDSIPLPDNAYEFGGEPERFTINLDNGSQVEMAGISFMFKNTGEDLAIKLEGSKGIFTIGCVHCDVDSQDDSGYAPCKLSDLVTKDIDYWALGHIHKRMVMHERPYVVYPGNPQGRNIKESGEKGAYVVTVTSNTLTDLRFVPTQTIIWERVEADITGCDLHGFLERVSSLIKKGSVVRLTITGRGVLDRMLRTAPDDVIKAIQTRSECIVEKIELKSKPESLPMTGGKDLVSKVAEVSNLVENADKKSLIEAICSTGTSKTYLQNYFEDLSDDELKVLVRDAEIRLLERFSEASE